MAKKIQTVLSLTGMEPMAVIATDNAMRCDDGVCVVHSRYPAHAMLQASSDKQTFRVAYDPRIGWVWE